MSTLQYSVGLESFLSLHDASHFIVPINIVRSSYNTLLHFAKAIPTFTHSAAGYELTEQGRHWVVNLDGAVNMWRGLFRDDESRALFFSFVASDLANPDYFFLGVWKDNSILFPGGPSPAVFPERGVLPPVIAPPSLSTSTQSPPSTTPSARGRRTSARGGGSRASGSRRRAVQPPSPFSSWADPVVPSHFDASGDLIPEVERLHTIQNEFRRYRGQAGYGCFNCRMIHADCVASLVDPDRCARCADLGRVCLPGPPITPDSMILSSARSSVPPVSSSLVGVPTVTPEDLAFLSRFNLTLPAFYEMVRQRGPGSSSG